MDKRNKIILALIAVLVGANLLVAGLLFYEKRQKDAMTKLVKNEGTEHAKQKIPNEIFGKIIKVENNEIEFIQIMQGFEYIEEEKRPVVKIRFSDETEILAPCPEIEHAEEETPEFIIPRREEDYGICPFDEEALLIGFPATIEETNGFATSIIVH